MKILGVIQARVGSIRLPQKVLMLLEGLSILEHVINRVRKSHLLNDLVVATTTRPDDDQIVCLCESIDAKVFRGSEDDVLNRFYKVSLVYNPNHVVRITADCPLISPEIIDKAIGLHISNGNDYTSNTINPTYPDGLDVEVFTAEALHEADKHAMLKSDREHVTPYMKKSDLLKVENFTNSIDLSDKRWTVDEPVDYEFISKIYAHLYKKDGFFEWNEVLKFLDENKNLENINFGIKRNVGYLESLEADKN